MSVQATRIRDRRKAMGINQEALAVLIGINQGQISRYESGESVPSSDVLAALARALHTSADWLLGLVDDLHESSLTPKEREILQAIRQGERLQAVRAIVMEE